MIEEYSYCNTDEGRQPDSDYYLNNYGTCSITPCSCLKTGWLGTLCYNWKPLGVKSLEELTQHFNSLKAFK